MSTVINLNSNAVRPLRLPYRADGELTAEEKSEYEAHVQGCEHCSAELRSLGRIVELTNEMRLRTPDDEFWDGYWETRP